MRSYAPILHFHPKEGRFCCFPSDAEEVYERYSKNWSDFKRALEPKTLKPNTPCYYETWERSEFLQIRYWFWYKFNRFPGSYFGIGDHVGDWEHVEVRLFTSSFETPAIWLLSNHNEFRLASNPPQYTFRNEKSSNAWLTERHVHVWVSLGSHAHYPHPRSKPYCFARVFCDIIGENGEVWTTEESLKPLNTTNFREFTGRWGDKNAPRSPLSDYNNPWRNLPPMRPIRINDVQ